MPTTRAGTKRILDIDFTSNEQYSNVRDLHGLFRLYFSENAVLKNKFENLMNIAKTNGVNLVLSKDSSRLWNYYDCMFFGLMKAFSNFGVENINIVETLKFDSSLNICLLLHCRRNQNLPMNTVLLMGEQIGVKSWEYNKKFLDLHKRLLVQSKLVLNYSLFQSLTFNRIVGSNNIMYMPFTMRQSKLDGNVYKPEKEHDIGFVGWPTEYRKNILDKLKQRWSVKTIKSFNNNFILREINNCRIFLNIHKNTTGRDIELSRICQGIGGDTIVVSEYTNDKCMENILAGLAIFCDRDEILSVVERILEDATYRNELVLKGREKHNLFKHAVETLFHAMSDVPADSSTCIVHTITSNIGSTPQTLNINKNESLTHGNNKFRMYNYVYTNDPNYGSPNVVVEEAKACIGMPENIQATYYKLQSHQLKLHRYSDYIIWVEPNFDITDSNAFSEFLIQELGDNDMMLFKHATRSCIYDEARYCIRTGLSNASALANQIKEYDLDEYPRGNGLFETAILIRKNIVRVNSLFDDVWMEYVKHSSQDQVAFPYCLRKHSSNIKVKIFDAFNIYNGVAHGFKHKEQAKPSF